MLINATKLLDALAIVGALKPAVDNPFLHVVRLRAGADGTIITGYDGHVLIELRLDATTDAPIDTLVRPQTLAHVVREIRSIAGRSDVLVPIKTSDDHVLCVGRIQIPAYPSRDFAARFSPGPVYRGVEYDSHALRSALDWVAPAVCQDDARVDLCGVWLHESNAVATDGHRLHLASGLPPVPEPHRIPTAALPAVLRALKGLARPVQLSATGLDTGSARIAWPRFDGRMMPYDQVIATCAHKGKIVVPRTELLAACSKDAIRLEGGDEKRISDDRAAASKALSNARSGATVEHTTLRGEWHDEPGGISILLGADQLKAALAVHGEPTVRVQVGGRLDPVVFEGPGRMALVMPRHC